jgi:type I restriction enzyme S subunit
MVLVAPDHIESGTGTLLAKVTAATQGAISGKYLFGAGDTLYSKIRPYLRKAVFVDSAGLTSADMYPLRPATDIEPRFLTALILSEHFSRFAEIVSMRSGFPKINREELAEYSAAIPPFPEQRQIASVLATIGDATRRAEQIIAKLQQIKQGLLHDFLTRGVDDNGELRDPERHPEQFKDSPLGRVPKQWAILELGTVVPSATYGISESLGDGPGTPVLRMMNFKDGEADLSDLKFSRSKEAREVLLQPGDVLFNRTNSIDHVGRTGIWRGQIPVASFASYLVRLQPDSERLRAEFLNRWLNWETTQLRIRRFATPGVHQVNINPTNLRRVLIALPTSLAEQDRAIEAMAALDARLEQEKVEIGKLRLVRQGLTEELLTGRVRVTKLLESAAQ